MATDVLAYLPPELTAPHEHLELAACLQALSAPEKLEGENAYVCDECDKRANAHSTGCEPAWGVNMQANHAQAHKEATATTKDACGAKPSAKPDAKPRQPALRYIQLSGVPRVLTLHLKRFRSTGRRVHKLDEHVPFPLELNLTPFAATVAQSPTHVSQLAGGRHSAGGGGGGGGSAASAVSTARPARAAEDRKLRLYAVVEHQGSFSGGHYIAYVRLESKWFRMSDSLVREVAEAEVLQKQAFMLFYERSG